MIAPVPGVRRTLKLSVPRAHADALEAAGLPRNGLTRITMNAEERDRYRLALGVFGAPCSVDLSDPPWKNTHAMKNARVTNAGTAREALEALLATAEWKGSQVDIRPHMFGSRQAEAFIVTHASGARACLRIGQ